MPGTVFSLATTLPESYAREQLGSNMGGWLTPKRQAGAVSVRLDTRI